MNALTFTHDPTKNHWTGYQPDGTRVGYIRPSRLHDARYAFEARIRRPLTGITDSAGYGATPDEAKRMLVSGWAFRCGGGA